VGKSAADVDANTDVSHDLLLVARCWSFVADCSILDGMFSIQQLATSIQFRNT
jgi:hypothetical protein